MTNQERYPIEGGFTLDPFGYPFKMEIRAVIAHEIGIS